MPARASSHVGPRCPGILTTRSWCARPVRGRGCHAEPPRPGRWGWGPAPGASGFALAGVVDVAGARAAHGGGGDPAVRVDPGPARLVHDPAVTDPRVPVAGPARGGQHDDAVAAGRVGGSAE